MSDLQGTELSLSGLLDINQATSEIISFFVTNSDSMPIVIDHNRVIRYCNPKLRELLGYGWQGDLVNGQTLIDELVPRDFREQHARLISNWFRYPGILQMHERAPIPVVTIEGRILQALIKLVPYEPREKGLRPIFDTPRFYPFGVAFITLLPESWKRHDAAIRRPASDHDGGASGQGPEHSAYRGEAGARPPASRGNYQPPPRGSAIDPALGADADRGYRPAQRPDLDSKSSERIARTARGIDQHGPGRY
jgi:PAS domain S-box-containing protein